MRRAASFSSLSLALFVLLIPSFAWGQYLALPGPGPIPPASDSPEYLAPSNETLDPPPPRGYAEDIRKAKLEAASIIGLAPGTVQYDLGASAGTGWAQPLRQLSVEQEGEPTPSAPALTTSFNGISYTGSFPPDPVIAAGPTNLVLITNGSVTIRDKTGTLVASTSLSAFFSSVRASGENTFDPRLLFDTESNRFFLSAVGRIANTTCTAGLCVSHFFLAISKTSSPATIGSSDWFFYAFNATLDGAIPTANWADFPGLGVDSSVVVLTANLFSFSNSTFQKAKIRILDKSVLIAGGAVTWTDIVGMTDPSTGFLSFSLQPALTFGSPGTFFLVSASQTLHSCDFIVWGIVNPLTSPTLSKLKAAAGGTCDVPPNAPQQGGGTPLDTGDTRPLNAVYRNGSVWAAHSTQANFGGGNVSAIRWVQIDVSSWPATVSRIQDSTFGADGVWYFYPTIMVDASNDLAIILARSSTSEFGSAYYTSRLGIDAVNTLQPSSLLKAGTANYLNLDSDGNNRWGDYFGIGLDPSDGSFWVLGEYAATSSEWGTWAGQLGLSSPVTAVSLTPDKPSPQPPNTTVLWTAVATGGTAPQFRFWVQPQGGPFALAQDYSPSNTFPWTPSATGDYTICVWAKSTGSGAAFEADACKPFHVGTATPVTGVSLAGSPPSPQPSGTPILWTATATGGIAPQFRFWVQPVGGPFALAQDYSSSNTFLWTPSAAGGYVVCVWARSSGSSAAKEADDCKPFQETAATPVTTVSLVPDKPSPQPLGTPILWTATATGGTAPQFRFWVQPVGGAFSILCDYSPSNTCPWTPAVAGDYVVIVWARSTGSPSAFEADKVVAFRVTAATPVTAVSLTPDKPSPQPVNTTIIWAAIATGGTAPQFRFWVQPVGGAFSILCDYSPNATCPWTPAVAGDYFVIVWAKSQGSPAAFEAFAVAAFSVMPGASGPQVRLINGLACNGQPFTADLRSAQGNVWTSFTGVFSPYQATARVIGPFDLRGCGSIVITFPDTVNLPTTGPQLFTMALDFQNSQVVLLFFQDTTSSATAGEWAGGLAVPFQTLEANEPVSRNGDYELRH